MTVVERAAADRTVAHILPWKSIGGTEMATLRVAMAARDRGFSSIAFCREGADEVRMLFRDAGFGVVTYAAVPPSYRSPRRFLRETWRLRRVLRDHRVDLVHCADVLAAFFGGYAAKSARVALICHVRNRYGHMSLRDRSFLLPVDRFVFVSKDTWTRFAHRVRPTKGVVLYDGIELDGVTPPDGEHAAVRAEFDVPADAGLVGMVARVAPQKDYRTLIEAAARVVRGRPNVRFLIVGDCSSTAAHREHKREVDRLIAKRGLESHFVFTGHRSDVDRLIDAMDVVVLSTHWEGLPLVLLEAMARGKPILATAVDGVPEAVDHERTGLLHPPGDADTLARHMRALLDAPDRRRSMGRAGRDRVAQEFSQDAFARNLVNIYSEMLGIEAPGRAEGRRRVALSGAPT